MDRRTSVELEYRLNQVRLLLRRLDSDVDSCAAVIADVRRDIDALRTMSGEIVHNLLSPVAVRRMELVEMDNAAVGFRRRGAPSMIAEPPSYKTSLCRHWWEETRRCPRGAACGFVHDFAELRWKVCDSFLAGRPCEYGEECVYLHSLPREYLY